MAALAFEIKDRIDHMFDNTRAGQCAFFRDVTYKDRRDPALFREGHNFMRRGPHLTDRSWCAVDGIGPHGLDRVDDHKVGLFGLKRGEDIAQVCLGREFDRAFL